LHFFTYSREFLDGKKICCPFKQNSVYGLWEYLCVCLLQLLWQVSWEIKDSVSREELAHKWMSIQILPPGCFKSLFECKLLLLVYILNCVLGRYYVWLCAFYLTIPWQNCLQPARPSKPCHWAVLKRLKTSKNTYN
jgi:hypothetical protein